MNHCELITTFFTKLKKIKIQQKNPRSNITYIFMKNNEKKYGN